MGTGVVWSDWSQSRRSLWGEEEEGERWVARAFLSCPTL